MAQQVSILIRASTAGSMVSLRVEVRNLPGDPLPFCDFTQNVQLPTTAAEVRELIKARIAAVVRDFNDAGALAAKAAAAAAAIDGNTYTLTV